MEIGICNDGHGEMSYEDWSEPYEPGTITVIPKNLPHVTISEEGKKSFWEYLFIDPAQIVREVYPEDEVFRRKVLTELEKEHMTFTSEGCPQLYQMIELLIYEMEHKEKHYKRVTKGLCEALLMELYRLCNQEKSEQITASPGRHLALLRPALEYVDANYMDSGLHIETLAGLCGLSETHFRRMFKEQTDMTPGEYVNMVRIHRACELLRKSHLSIDEISARVGYESATSLTRNFKKLLDITPYQWKMHPQNSRGNMEKYNILVRKGW
jgi:AraC-like DNA-binding protein